MIDLAGSQPLGGGIHAFPGVELSTSLRNYLRNVRSLLDFDLVVTSGIRTPVAQASAWRKKLDLGQTKQNLLDLYKRDDLVEEVFAAGDLSVLGMTTVLEAQVARGDYLSSHMTGRALDLRVRGYTDSELERLDHALRMAGGRVVTEATPPHKHVELSGSTTDRREPSSSTTTYSARR